MMFKYIDKNLWAEPWPETIKVLKMMYPETVIAKRDAMVKAKVDFINFMTQNIHTGEANRI